MTAVSGDSKAARLRQWQAGQTPGPWEIILFPTNRCNLKCSICWQRWAEKEFGKVDFSTELSDERLLALVDEAAEMGVREWRIVGGGEPMVRGSLVIKLCERIRRHGMNGLIQSNGTRFTAEQFDTLVKIGWKTIVVSLDGHNAETNDAVRSKGSFEQATKNLRILADIKARHKASQPEVYLSTVITRLNYDRLEDVVRLAKDLGGTMIGAIGLIVQGPQSAELALSPEQTEQLPEYMERARTVAEELGITGNLYPPENLEGWPQCAPVINANPDDLVNAACFEPWLTMAILAEDGKAGPCAPFWQEDAETVREKSLRDVWLSPYFQNIRARILAHRDFPPYCRTCCSDIPRCTQLLRDQVLAGRTAPIAELPMRFIRNLKSRGLGQTARRAYEWLWLRTVGRR